MNNKALTLSLIMAVKAVFFVQSYVSSIEEEEKKKYGTNVLVVVAKKDIREMDTINETQLEYMVIPKRYLEPAAVSVEKKEEDAGTAKALKLIAGNVAVVPIKKGEQITYNKITDPSMRTGLSPQIAPGKRAISIPVSEISGISKLVKPGDRVDLISVVDLGGGKDRKIAKTVLQDVVILAVGRYITNNVARAVEMDPYGGKERIKPLAEDYSFSTVTIEVDPIQVQSVFLLLNSGDNALTLSLRNNDDLERVNLPDTSLVDMFGELVRGRGGAQRR